MDPSQQNSRAVEHSVEPLLRELVGEQLRAERRRQRRTLVDVAEKAGISMQHLSDVERGRKDPSSEVLAAITGALGLPLLTLLRRSSGRDEMSGATLAEAPLLLDLTAGRDQRLQLVRARSRGFGGLEVDTLLSVAA